MKILHPYAICDLFRCVLFCAFSVIFFHLFSYLPQNEVSEQENRTLEQRPNFGYASLWNHQFGKHTENWLKDQFPYREEIIKAQFKAMHKINGRTENEKAFMLDNGWFFNKWKTVRFLTKQQEKRRLNLLKNSLNKISTLATLKKTSVIFVILPSRESIYQNLWIEHYEPYDIWSFYKKVLNIIRSYPNIDVMYPYDELKNMGTEDPAFLKDDGHLSSRGADYILNEIYKKIQQKYFPNKDIKYEVIHDLYNSGDISVKLGFNRKKTEAFIVKDAKVTTDEQKISQFQVNRWMKQTEVLNPIIDKNLYLYGVCYSTDTFYPLLKYFFKKTQTFSIHSEMESQNEEEILEGLKEVWQNLENNSLVILIIPHDIPIHTIKILENSLKGLK